MNSDWKVQYVDEETVIHADNLNEIQDKIDQKQNILRINPESTSQFLNSIGINDVNYSINGVPDLYLKDASSDGKGISVTKSNGVVVKFEPTIPTKTSELTNDSGFLTEHQSLNAYRTSANQDVIDNAISGRITTIEGKEAGWDAKSTVSGNNDGTNWTDITINGTTKNIPVGGGGSSALKCHFYFDEEQGYICDKTFPEVKAAIQNGNQVIAYGTIEGRSWTDPVDKNYLISSATYRDNVKVREDEDEYREVIQFSMPWGRIIGEYGQVSEYSAGETYVLWTRLKVPYEGDYEEQITWYDHFDSEPNYACEAGGTSGEYYERFEVDTGSEMEKLCKKFISGSPISVSRSTDFESAFVQVTCQNTMKPSDDIKCWIGNVTTCWPTGEVSGSTVTYTFKYYMHTIIVEQHYDYEQEKEIYYFVMKTKLIS